MTYRDWFRVSDRRKKKKKNFKNTLSQLAETRPASLCSSRLHRKVHGSNTSPPLKHWCKATPSIKQTHLVQTCCITISSPGCLWPTGPCAAPRWTPSVLCGSPAACQWSSLGSTRRPPYLCPAACWCPFPRNTPSLEQTQPWESVEGREQQLCWSSLPI